MAHFSEDKALCKVLQDTKNDPFKNLASIWLKQPIEQVNTQQRHRAKRLAYGLLYGMGANALASELECTVQEAAQLSKIFKESLPGVEAWNQQVLQSCRNTTSVDTLDGRRRYLLHILNKDSTWRSYAERQAVNTICQGSAADLVKRAMIQLTRKIKADESCKLVLQVHDELVFYVAENKLTSSINLIRACLENSVKLKVPIPVKFRYGASWGELEQLQ